MKEQNSFDEERSVSWTAHPVDVEGENRRHEFMASSEQGFVSQNNLQCS